MLSWIEERIKKLPTAAAYHKDDPSQPVSWALTFSSRQIGPFYTTKAHRNKGLGLATAIAICEVLLDDAPDIPLFFTADKSCSMSLSLASSIGFKDQMLDMVDIYI